MISKNTIAREILGKVEIETILKRIQGKKLKQTERNYLSRSIRPKLIAARMLTEEKILEKIQRPDKSLKKKIIYNLDKYGYKMITLEKIKKQKMLSIEELIAVIITRCPSARFIEAIPVLLLKNKMDKFKLVEIANGHNITNQLGYLMEIAMIIAKRFNIKNDFSELLSYLKKNKEKEIAYLGEKKDSAYNVFILKTSPPRIRKWNLLGRFFDEDFIKNAEAYL